MKKMLALTMALAMVFTLASCGKKDPAPSGSGNGSSNGSSNSLTTVEAGKLHMSTNASFPPYEMVADDGSFEGIDVEIAEKIAEKLGLELVIDDMGFDASLAAAQNGKSDMVMAGVTVTKKRLEVMDFSNTYANGVQVVIVKEGSPIETPDDLGSAKMIGCQMGTTGYLFCSAPVEEGGFGEDHVTPYEDGSAAVQALMNDQVDAVVIDNMPAQAYVASNPGLKILEGEFANEKYAIGVAKNNTQLLDAINGILDELTADGTIQNIVDSYIKAD